MMDLDHYYNILWYFWYYEGITGNERLSYELYRRTSVISTTYI